MSQNIEQIYIANPITSNAGTDLMYFGQSPYGAGDDAAMLYSNFSAQFIPTGGAVLLNPAGDQTILNNHNLIMATGSMVAPTMLPGNLSLSGNTLSSTNSNGSIDIIPNGTGPLLFGSSTAVYSTSSIQNISTSGQALYYASSFNNTANANAYIGTKSRGTTVGSFTAVQSGDKLINLVGFGSDGTSFIQAGFFQVEVDASVSTGVVPGRLTLYTTNAAGVSTLGMALDHNQILTLANALLPASGGLGTSTAPTAGQIPIGTSGGVYTPAAISSGAGILVANSSGAITISATGGGIGWTAAPSTPVTAVINTGYYVTDASQVTFSLPTTAAAGSVVKIVGNGAGGWILQPGAGQTIKVLSASASTSITSAEQYDCIEVLCTVANTTWVTMSMVTTGFTIA